MVWLDTFLYLAGFQTFSADINSFYGIINMCFYFLNIGMPHSFSNFMRMTYFISKLWTFTTNVTFWHFIYPPASCKKYLTVDILSYYMRSWQVNIYSIEYIVLSIELGKVRTSLMNRVSTSEVISLQLVTCYSLHITHHYFFYMLNAIRYTQALFTND